MTIQPHYRWNMRTKQEVLSGTEDVLSLLIALRGFSGEQQKFFCPEYETMFHDSAAIPDFMAVVDRIMKAVKQKEHVVIYGDYDADGITSSAILYEAFQKVGGMAEVILPHRETDGYGLSSSAVASLSPSASLLVAVDNGTTAHEAIAVAKKKGMDVVVIDHHEVQGTLPKDVLVANTMREDSHYPFSHLCAAGLAFLVAREMCARTLQEGQEKWFLDLAAIGTIADRVPLVDINRGIVRYGLEVMRVGRRQGLVDLADNSGVFFLNTEMLAFRIIPRLNAAGRLEHPDIAFQLLVTHDGAKTRALARSLEEINRRRKKMSEAARVEIEHALTRRVPIPDVPFVVGNWHVGIVGLLAGKVSEDTNRPVAVASVSSDPCVGSMRGNGSGSVVHLLQGIHHCLDSFGGHEEAAGFSFSRRVLPEVQEYFDALQVISRESGSHPELSIDCSIDPVLVDTEFIRRLQVLEPHGDQNERPVFLLRNMKVLKSSRVGTNGAHARFSFSHSGSRNWLTGVSFRWGGRTLPDPGQMVDVACELHSDRFRGRERIDMRIKDIQDAK